MNLTQYQKHQNKQVAIKQALQKFVEESGRVVEVFIGATDSFFKKKVYYHPFLFCFIFNKIITVFLS